MTADRYDRQQRIDGWDQKALQAARVMVVGAGAIGNELIKNLALLGVGHLLIIDFDRVEASNLSRTVLFQHSHLGQSKAQRAAGEAAAIAFALRATTPPNRQRPDRARRTGRGEGP
jgi:adenylyltransferase/sulfurtransferase